MSDNGQKEMLETIKRILEKEEPIPGKVSNSLVMGGLIMVYDAAKSATDRSRKNEIQMKLQWAAIAILGGLIGAGKFLGFL